MDLVIPIRPGGRNGPEPVQWLLRTYEHHWEAIDRVFIVGHLPRNLDPSEVIHIPTDQHRTKFENVGENLEATLRSEELGEEFIWANDDMFLIEDLEEPLPLYRRPIPYREVVAEWEAQGPPEHRAYVIGMKAQLEILEDWGYSDPICTELHVPIPIDRSRLTAITDRAWKEYPELERGHFRGIYGGTFTEKESVPMADVKHRPHRGGIPAKGARWISTSPVSWNIGEVGKWIRRKYWRKSRWEKP